MAAWRHPWQAYILLAVTSNVSALQHDVQGSEREAFRQKMYNYQDLQYSVDLKVGGQIIRGILDTGSFELLIFPAHCHTCGQAKSYNPNSSNTFVQGKRNRVHTYGSGSCTAMDGHERISVGPMIAKHQAFWHATGCQMPMLNKASFNAVVGIGPPGEPEVIARNGLMRVKSLESRARQLGKPIPTHIRHLKKTYTEDLNDAPKKTAMLVNLGVKKFSVCLERDPGSSGWLVWNDNHPQPASAFTKIDIVGEVTWGIKLTGIGMHGGATKLKDMIGCQKGCGAIVDTGTSLLAVPSNVYEKVYNTVQDMGLDCDDISRYPDLVLHIGDKRLQFPPDSYMGALVGEPTNEVKKYMRLSSFDKPRGQKPQGQPPQGQPPQGQPPQGQKPHEHLRCELLLMDLGDEQTQFGPMAILGMPFFREYYTTFDIGKGPGSRSLNVAPSDSQCRPSKRDVTLDSDQNTIYSIRKNDTRPRAVRRIDASTLHPPRWPAIYGSSSGMPPII